MRVKLQDIRCKPPDYESLVELSRTGRFKVDIDNRLEPQYMVGNFVPRYHAAGPQTWSVELDVDETAQVGQALLYLLGLSNDERELSTWTTKEGSVMLVAEMKTDHLLNSARMMLRTAAWDERSLAKRNKQYASLRREIDARGETGAYKELCKQDPMRHEVQIKWNQVVQSDGKKRVAAPAAEKEDYVNIADKLKQYDTDRVDPDERVALSALARNLEGEYKALGLDQPEWLDDKARAIRKDIADASRDLKLKRLKDARQKLDSLKTAEDKRADLKTEIEKLEKELA